MAGSAVVGPYPCSRLVLLRGRGGMNGSMLIAAHPCLKRGFAMLERCGCMRFLYPQGCSGWRTWVL
eukprot:jgi/Mesvir1/24072/Mv25238-RA.1